MSIWQTRTFWAGLGTLVAALLRIYGVGAEYAEAATAILGFLTLIFVREAIEKNGIIIEDIKGADFGDGDISNARQP